MNSNPEADTYAAVDLGSNSFHMLVARREHGEMRVLDRIKEMVRLGGGLDSKGNLDPEVRQRALECLSRFGQRLRGIPAHNIRAVGTQTFRRLRKANEFLLEAEQLLECPVDIIAGREEARLIYLGVTQWIAGHQQKQLVIDIGGGSTELIIGEGFEPVEMESLQFGCVAVTNRFFADGEITAKKLKKAQRAVAAELQEIQTVYARSPLSCRRFKPFIGEPAGKEPSAPPEPSVQQQQFAKPMAGARKALHLKRWKSLNKRHCLSRLFQRWKLMA
jgi:exopolyphosphatase/guanosine-5'-triphosphate,3'-diphosphate pyrophosphatase